MRNEIITTITIMIIISCSTITTAYSFGGSMIRSLGREAAAIAERKTAKEVLREAGEMGAEKLGKFIAKYGDEGRRLYNIMGDDIIRITAKHGCEVIDMCAGHSRKAALYLAKNAEEMLPVWRQFGKEGTELAVRYPGLGTSLLESCGPRGITVAKKLSRENLNRLAFFSKRISRENLDELITWLLGKGDEAMAFAWRNKKVLLTGGGVYALLKDYPNGFTTTEFDAEGKPIRSQTEHNFFQHIVNQTVRGTGHWLGQNVHEAVAHSWLPLLGIGLFVSWLGPILAKLWHWPRKRRLKTK